MKPPRLASGISIAVAKNRVTAGDYSSFLQLSELIAKAFDRA